MRTLTVHARKGGVGKTSLVAGVAEQWAQRGARVLLVDADPQASLTRWLAADPDGPGLFAVLADGQRIADVIAPTVAEGVSIVRGSRELATLDKALAGRVGNEKKLARALQTVSGAFDAVLIDTPPALCLGVVQCLFAADAVCVPCEPSPLGLEGVRDAVALVADVAEANDGRPILAGVVASRVQSRRALVAEVLEALREAYGRDLLRATVREAVAIAEAPSHRMPISAYAPSAPVVEDLSAVAIELAKRIQLKGGRDEKA